MNLSEMLLEYVIIGVIVGSAIIIVKSLNPIYSILNLIVLYFSYACYLLTLEMEFLACILILVNVGAVAVLFLFIVMMININVVEIKETVKKYYPYVILGFLGLLSLIVYMCLTLTIYGHINTTNTLGSEGVQNYILYYSKFNQTIDLKVIGSNLIYGSSYSIWFILACIILLTAMIGVIYITEDLIKKRELNKRKQNIYDQIEVSIKDKIKGYRKI